MRPGTRFRALARRFCAARTMERLIDPAVADLQHEYAEAVAVDRPARAASVLIAGYWSLLKVIGRGLGGSDAARGPIVALAATGAFTVILVALPLVRLSRVLDTRAGGSVAELALCLVPQALVISVPAGLFAAILIAWRDPAARLRHRGLIVCLALVASLATLVNGQWVAPETNQAFRETIAGRPLLRGAAELSLTELGRRVRMNAGDDDHETPARVSGMLHVWLAFAAAPLVIAGFVLAVAGVRRRLLRQLLTSATAVAVVSYYALLPPALHAWMSRALPPLAIAWLPIAFLSLVTFAIVGSSSRGATDRV